MAGEEATGEQAANRHMVDSRYHPKAEEIEMEWLAENDTGHELRSTTRSMNRTQRCPKARTGMEMETC